MFMVPLSLGMALTLRVSFWSVRKHQTAHQLAAQHFCYWHCIALFYAATDTRHTTHRLGLFQRCRRHRHCGATAEVSGYFSSG